MGFVVSPFLGELRFDLGEDGLLQKLFRGVDALVANEPDERSQGIQPICFYFDGEARGWPLW
jgi:hypothetical protein